MKKKNHHSKSMCSQSTATKWANLCTIVTKERQHICNPLLNSWQAHRMHLDWKQWILTQKFLVASVWEMKPARQAPLRMEPALCLWVSGGTGRELTPAPCACSTVTGQGLTDVSPSIHKQVKNKTAQEFKSGAKYNSSGSSSPEKRSLTIFYGGMSREHTG